MDNLEPTELLDLPHKEVCEYMNKELNDIIKDPLLKDLPVNPTVEEINSRLALEKGKAIIIYLKRQSQDGSETIRVFFLFLSIKQLFYLYL